MEMLLLKFRIYLAQFGAMLGRPEPKAKDEWLTQLKLQIKDGDCLLSHTEYEVSNVVERAKGIEWGHAAIYIRGFVYEAVTGGVRKTSLECFVYKKDRLALCRLNNWTEGQIDKMEHFLNLQVLKPYDWSFGWSADFFSSKAWYCSKLVLAAWDYADERDLESKVVGQLFGEKFFSPQDVWNLTTRLLVFT